MLLEPPRTLPVGHLSPSSVSMYLKSPIRWKRRYVDNEYEPETPAALLGTATGAAERDSVGVQIQTGRPMSEREVLDAFSDEWQLALDLRGDNIVWNGERPGRVKDSGYRVLPMFHRLVAPTIRKPTAVERKFTIHVPDVEWTITGYFDVEEPTVVHDNKMRSRGRGVVTQEQADEDLQAGTYLLARRSESDPAQRFAFNWMLAAKKGVPVCPGDVGITVTGRTHDELDLLIDLYYRVAAEMHWRLLYDVWVPPPPGTWWCSSGWCGFWHTCEFGGKLRGPRPAAPRRRIPDAEVYAAIAATKTKRDGATTAAKVARHLGMSVRVAAARLAALPDVVSGPPVSSRMVDPITREPSRKKDAVREVKRLPGPNVYRHDTSGRELLDGLQAEASTR